MCRVCDGEGCLNCDINGGNISCESCYDNGCSNCQPPQQEHKIVSTMPYEQITMVKIFWDGVDFCVDFILGDISHLYVVKKDKCCTLAFGEEPICSHMETDFYFTEGGAESFKEKFEIDELLAVSELVHVCNWRLDESRQSNFLERTFNPAIIDREETWIDPAGGVHSIYDIDPAKLYE